MCGEVNEREPFGKNPQAKHLRGSKKRGEFKRVLDCGGKRSATPLSFRTERHLTSKLMFRVKAVSSLRSATALQNGTRV